VFAPVAPAPGPNASLARRRAPAGRSLFGVGFLDTLPALPEHGHERPQGVGGDASSLVSDDDLPEGLLAGKVAEELAEVDAALGRIAAGSYGTCISCGGPLGLQRLRAIPEARFCLGCSGHRPGDD